MTVIATLDLLTLLESIKPMLADTQKNVTLETLMSDGKWLADQKLDGIRALAVWTRDGMAIRNRNGRDITAQYLDLEVSPPLCERPLLLDGEIIAQSGSFQDTQKRDKQRQPAAIVATMNAIPASFVAFDVLYHPTRGDVRHLPYIERRQLLLNLGLTGPWWDISMASTHHTFYDQIAAMGGEGVVAKRLSAPYTQGRKTDWLKFKNKSTLTCVGVGYEPGEGAREAFGAMLLALVDGNKVVSVGRVGSGFTLPETLEMKALLDSGRMPLVEIECLGKTRDGRLRQPVYIGQRTDLLVTDANVAQLDNIPTC
jgi:bifunctional non-homologous end joining protein LigD